MNLPNFGKNDLKNKIKNIKSTYVQEVNKIKRTIKSGMSPDEAYVSHLPWFKTADRFLKQVINTREQYHPLQQPSTSRGSSASYGRKFPSLGSTCDRSGVSDCSAESIVSALLENVGLEGKDNISNVVD
ncbi:unnamed protein product [Psylliodes chrysocephalus]|uniref:MADF domain-containing protein n=1 Tax=Psylliodes chrysocephalus TaxID=3402493 RepID=A0A9P0G9Z7_9CUCU|nr:unnamed protein product [Psylliodes chrysocephala]